ncbi:MocR-like pyridoxine biosynthesis transcription factor PdxR [Streptomyces boluensis]|uniref:Aminotransferase class I/II-fold pyridoxal phosphate-dependent enzyme n=1 Tax=Streptomyces boluensis TaxID=1775135 RepID=A0A964XLR0_9ACTN|nr:PLP-dependent aminotransferase family protein [Streptomyces boluensis]NBE53739.1 aminotransferase class I/II-fold pyridoxal phosphate-dependent enzyme [Streptomyces boluensis]
MAVGKVNSELQVPVAPSGTGSDLHLDLSPDGSRRAALLDALRTAVRSGRLAAGTPLPPYRALATDLGVARNTVAEVYAELVAEGWLVARQGSGTRVAERTAPARPVRVPKKTPAHARGARFDLRQGQPDALSFPRTAWLASARRALNAAPHEAFGPQDPQGRIELRTVLAEYLTRARGVRAAPERIVVCSGFAHALRLLFGGAGGRGHGVLSGPLAVEEYGLGFHRALLADAGVRTVPLPLDEQGARIDELGAQKAVLLSPAHQFPTGGPLHAERRAAAVDWARARGALVLEDDYDGEFRYDRRPVGALQGLDPERVVHLGSVSKSLSPALRLGWMVLPEHLVEQVLRVKGEREAWAGVTDQLTLADLIACGAYDRHVRRMRLAYRRRRDLLVRELARRAPHIEVTGVAAGLHAVLRLPPGTEPSTLKAARWQGVDVDGLAGFRHPNATGPLREGLVVGYATPPERVYPAAVDALCAALPPDATA